MNEDATQLIDSHAHLDDDAFKPDRERMLQRALEAGITDIVLPAVTAERWPRLRDLAAASPASGPRLHAGYGLHPMFMQQHREAHLQDLVGWLEREPAVAVGECGLDFYRGDDDAQRQRMFFRAQLDIARERDLPVIMHARKAVEEIILTLRRDGPVRGVVHSYSGSPEQARQLWQLGMHVSLGGPLTHARARRLHRLVAELPLEQLLLETDAPDQPGARHRGERNEPAFLTDVLDCVARLRDQSRASIARTTSANARDLFGLA